MLFHNSFYLLIMIGNIHDDLSIGAKKVAVDGFCESLGRPSDTLVLELDLALSTIIILGANIAIKALQCKNHVVEGWDVELEVFVPNGIQVALLDGGFLVSIVVVAKDVVLFE